MKFDSMGGLVLEKLSRGSNDIMMFLSSKD